VQPPGAAPSLTPEQRLRQQAGLVDLAFGSGADNFSGWQTATQHLAFLPPEELALDLDDPKQCHVGDYTLLEKLGQGGMGVVYRARQESLDREVALKLLAAGPWASRDFIDRFRREAQSAARMEHPNIVGIYEIGRHDELNFFSMRLVRGPSLSHRLAKDGPMAPRAAAQLLRTVAEAVDYAHRLGVLHLDLKPGNVLIDDAGVPHVADFGLARRMDESLGHDSDEVSGTPSYMAPEQAQTRSHRLSAATDIYGLGAIGYEMLCGRPPFLGDSPHETLLRVVQLEAPPLREQRDCIPADLEAIVAKCLAKDPAQRYPSARALADDLARFLDGRAVSVRRPPWYERLSRWARRDPKLAVAAVAAVSALVVGMVTTSLQWKRAEANAAASRALLWEGRREAALRTEEDGKGLAAMALLLDNIREAEGHGSDDDARRDRLRLGLLASGGATLIDTFALGNSNPFAVELSPDGATLAVAFSDVSVRWYDTASLTERGRVELADRGTSDGQRRPPVLLRFAGPDRLRVTFDWYLNLANPTDGDSWLVDLATARVVEPPPAFADLADVVYSADGKLALLRDKGKHTQAWSVAPWAPLSPLGEATPDFQPWLLDPRGRFALDLGIAMRELSVHALPEHVVSRRLQLPGNVGISAWALSNNGDTLALGDFEGRVFLLDTATWTPRPLPSSRGREITWLAFSEDDAWVATAGFDGAIQAFDVASGDALVSGRMQAGFAPRRLGLSRRERMLVAAGQGRTALWRLPATGPRALPAQRIGFEPAAHALAGPFSVGWSLDSGLLATAGMDGQVRLYRLPRAPLQEAWIARQTAPGDGADSRWLVDVEWNRMRLVSTVDDRRTAWLALPQPPGFAEALLGGRVVATIGTRLHVYATETMQPIGTPIELPGTPQRLLATPDGKRIVLDFGGHGRDGVEARLRAYDLDPLRELPGEVVVPGPLRQVDWSGDGRRLLAVGPSEGETTVLDRDLERLASFEHDPFEPVQWAAFAASGPDLWLVTRASDPRFGGDALVRWAMNAATEPVALPLPNTQPIGVLATNAGVFVAGVDRDLWWPTGADAPRALPRRATGESLALAVVSPDGRLLAHAFRGEVQIHDAATAEPLGLPLPAGLHALDFIATLAFTADGRYLRARSALGRTLEWPVAAETRPAEALARFLARVSTDSEDQSVLRVPGKDEREALRARDPGRWRAPDPRPPIDSTVVASDGAPVPRRAPGTPARLVALDAVYTNGPDTTRNTFYSILPSIRSLPGGVQRIGTAEFDVRGMVQLGVVGYESALTTDTGPSILMSNGTQLSAVRCLTLPAERAAALHLLLRPSLRAPIATGHPLLRMVLRYADGSSAAVPLHAGVEMPGYAGDDQSVPQVFTTYTDFPNFGLDPVLLSAPRVANPHPERTLRCVDFSTVTYGAAVLLLGLTLEPPAPPPAP
jgi:WD40 repeat protein